MRVTSEPHNLLSAQHAAGLASPETFEMDDSTILSEVDQEHGGSAERSHTGHGLARHTLGLLLLLTVVFLWTMSNFLGSSIFADDTYAKPFFVTYLNTSTFVLFLVPGMAKNAGRPTKDASFARQLRRGLSRCRWPAPWRRKPDSIPADMDDETEAFIKPVDEVIVPPGDLVTSHLSISETVRLSLIFCPLWFGANYFAMSCLQYTTVASTTILTSTSSMWTLLLGAITHTEKFTWRKFAAVVASLLGIALISQVDLKSQPQTNTPERALDEFPDKKAYELLFGDALALFSALIYGFYTITLKKTTLAVEPRSLHMPTFFGLVGLFNVVLMLPVFPILHLTGLEKFSLPPTSHVWTILLINSASSLLSDIAWAYAMIFTSPLVVTVGLSLTIPLSLIGEMIIQGRFESWIYWVGAAIVVGSFIFVERDEKKEENYIERNAQGMSDSMLLRDHENDGESGSNFSADGRSRQRPKHMRTTSLLDDEDDEQRLDLRDSLDHLSEDT